eukprot:snap_masked-scaffold_38-processed-gene-2.48-mRNA-1 protein AED:0.07 eAED:0.07 QI:0/-1/0/1/-1/1/1/0/317
MQLNIANLLFKTSFYLLFLILLSLLQILLPNLDIFFKRYGQRHRISGLVHLFLLSVYLFSLFYGLKQSERLLVNIVLGISGIVLTLTAAFDFQKVHEKKTNVASGPLQEETTVTYSEMIEHAFYQGLNLLQIIYIYMSTITDESFSKFILLALVTSPWLFRKKFPINSFSANYTKGQKVSIYTILYRIKKYQYVFYKHIVLHGLNITFAVSKEIEPYFSSTRFYLFWLCLNSAYVFEFFFQSLVRKKVISQRTMLVLNQSLMLTGSIAGVELVFHVHPFAAALSLFLNFFNRGNDFLNVVLTFFVVLMIQQSSLEIS